MDPRPVRRGEDEGFLGKGGRCPRDIIPPNQNSFSDMSRTRRASPKIWKRKGIYYENLEGLQMRISM